MAHNLVPKKSEFLFCGWNHSADCLGVKTLQDGHGMRLGGGRTQSGNDDQTLAITAGNSSSTKSLSPDVKINS
jgi:hypothetical protein